MADEFIFDDFIFNQEPEFGRRTSLDNPSSWTDSDYFGIGLFDAIEDHDPYNQEALDFAANIKYQDVMARDAGWHPYANPSWIENNPSVGLDYMKKIFGGIGRLGFRKNVDDVGKRGEGGNMYLDFIKSF